MARIPTHTRQITPSGATGEVFIPSDIADTGEGLEAQGLANLGKGIEQGANVIAELVLRERKADDLIASDNASIARQSAADSYLQDKEDNEDPNTWIAAAKQRRTNADEAFSALKFNDPQRAERERNRHKAAMNHFEAIAKLQVTDAKAKIAVKATTDSFVTAFATNLDDLKAKERALDEALLNEFGKDLALIEKKKIFGLAERQRIAVLISLEDFEEARTFAEKTIGLTPTEREAQLNIIDRAERAAENSSKKQSELELSTSAAKIESNWLKKLEAGTLTRTDILAWNPALTHPEAIRESIDIKEEWLKKLSRPIGTSSGYFSLIQDIDTRPQDFTASDIYKMVKPSPDGITEKEAPSLVKRLESNKNPGNAFNRSLHSRYQSILKSQFKNDIIDVGNKKENAAKQNELSLAMTEFANTNPEATEKDFANKYGELTNELRKTSGFFSGLRTLELKDFFGPFAAFRIGRAFAKKRDKNLIDLNPTSDTSKQKTKLKVGDVVERNGISYVVTRFENGRPKVVMVE